MNFLRDIFEDVRDSLPFMLLWVLFMFVGFAVLLIVSLGLLWGLYLFSPPA